MKKYSIANRLTLSLMLTVGIVEAITITGLYLYSNRIALATLQNKADITIGYLLGTLEIPLWQMNTAAVKVIGKSVSQNELVTGLTIRDDYGTVLYQQVSNTEEDLIERRGVVRYGLQQIGSVELLLTKRFYKTNSRNQLISFITIAIFVLASLLFATGVFIRKFLKKPLEGLNRIVASYGKEEYEMEVANLPYREFSNFENILRQMGSKISYQIQELKEAEQKYRSIFDNAVEGVFQATVEGRFKSANPSMARILGYDSPEDLMASIYDIRNQLYVDPVQRDIIYRFEKGDALSALELNLYKKDGSTIWASLSARAVRSENGDVVLLEGFLTDITEQKNSAEALRKSEEKYKHIFENVSDFLFVHDLEGNLIDANLALKREIGVDTDETLHLNLREWIAEEYRSLFDDYLTHILTNGSSEGVATFLMKTGRQLVVEYRNSLIHDQNGVPIAVQGSGRDISDKVRVKKEKKKLELQLQQAQRMESIGTLAGGIAHDFNNILMAIQGRTSLILMNVEADHPACEHLKGIERYVNSAADLTNRLLGITKGGKYEVKPTNINDLVTNSSQMFGRTKKEINIHRNLPQGTWAVEVDRGQIDQVLLNLFVNAAQAMPDGGNLYIETRNWVMESEMAKQFTVPAGNYVRISVTDTGIGMEESILNRIFDPFFTTKKMGRGTGLGLASAYGIIRNHDGVITVESEIGKGSTFTIFLPASEKEVNDQTERHQLRMGHQESILLVDDEEMVLTVGRMILEKLNYNVTTASSGSEAIGVYAQHHRSIRLVILDMIMPEMGGHKVFDQLKEIDANVLVLVSSGYSIDMQTADLMNRGCRGFIQKPFKIEKLSIKIREILDDTPPASKGGMK